MKDGPVGAGTTDRFDEDVLAPVLVEGVALQRGVLLFSVLMGEDVEARRSFITRNAKDVRFLDI